MENTTGVIEKIAQKTKSYGVLVKDNWYNAFGECEFKEGNLVEIEYITKTVNGKTYNNIEKISVFKEKEREPMIESEPSELNELIAQEIAKMARIRTNILDVFKGAEDNKRFPELNSIVNSVYIELNKKLGRQ